VTLDHQLACPVAFASRNSDHGLSSASSMASAATFADLRQVRAAAGEVEINVNVQ